MEIDLEIAKAAASRWQTRTSERTDKIEKLRSGGVSQVETPERIHKRLQRLEQIATQETAIRHTERSAGTQSGEAVRSFLVETIGFERVLGKADFLGINFLEMALAVSRFVGRINIRTSPGRTAGFGTGFMVSPRLLMTNNHVLASVEAAFHSEVEFDYQNDKLSRLLPVVPYALDPQTFFITNRDLDYTLVAVKEHSVDGKVALKNYGWSRLNGQQGKALLGDSLNIIQHPKGDVKQIVLRSNQLVDLLDTFAHYTTDTEPGSSGSPVYNDQWEVVALHHSGVPKTEGDNFMARDGSIWRPGMDPDQLEWVANEGVRISSLVEHIQKQALSPEQQVLRDELLNLEPLHPLEAAKKADEESRRIDKPMPNAPADFTQSPHITDAGATWTIPLQVTVQVGVPVATNPAVVNNAAESPTKPGSQAGAGSKQAADTLPAESESELQEVLAEVERAATRDYYNQEQDERNRDSYYSGLSQPADSTEFFKQLSALVQRTHTTVLRYKPSTHVYPWVDLHEAESKPKLKSIYSGRDADPRDFIREDLRLEGEWMRLREAFIRESTATLSGLRTQLDFLEATLPFNCEHVVPQSWFDKKEPMRGDLHHLFACESGCNSFRGNTPYYDFPDFEEVIREACGKREDNKFEPSFGKGAVARATLYFLLRYPGEINDTAKEYTADRLDILLEWHRVHPVTRYEKHRNAAIQEKQGNRNPLIDHPEFAGRIDFKSALGS
jgi:endonuclease I/V8-like Glu-specific endopeptidase